MALTMYQALLQVRGTHLVLYLLLEIKFYWNAATPIHIRICIIYGCFHDEKAELSRSHRLFGLNSLKYLLSDPLQEKSADRRSKCFINIKSFNFHKSPLS